MCKQNVQNCSAWPKQGMQKIQMRSEPNQQTWNFYLCQSGSDQLNKLENQSELTSQKEGSKGIQELLTTFMSTKKRVNLNS